MIAKVENYIDSFNQDKVLSQRDLINQTQGSATASDIIKGKTAWANGELLTGTYEEPAYSFTILVFGTTDMWCNDYLPKYKNVKVIQTSDGTSTSASVKKYDWADNGAITNLAFNTAY